MTTLGVATPVCFAPRILKAPSTWPGPGYLFLQPLALFPFPRPPEDPPFPPWLSLTQWDSRFRGTRGRFACTSILLVPLASGSSQLVFLAAWAYEPQAVPLEGVPCDSFPEPSCLTVVFKDTDSCQGSGFVHRNKQMSVWSRDARTPLPPASADCLVWLTPRWEAI